MGLALKLASSFLGANHDYFVCFAEVEFRWVFLLGSVECYILDIRVLLLLGGGPNVNSHVLIDRWLIYNTEL